MWDNSIAVGLSEIGWNGVEWIDLARDMDKYWVLVSMFVNLFLPQMLGCP
jgi:hypothetical protein